MKYGLGVLTTTASFVAHRVGILKLPRFMTGTRKVAPKYYSGIVHRP